jgi:tetratricopeptide (TPR) repeat protein
VDVRRTASELGVRYLLEGSARRAAGRVRINVELIDAIGGGHMWAGRFDRNLEDIFAVQDEVTAKIVEALIGRLVAPPPRNRPKNMEAYDLCVRGRVLISSSAGSLETVREATVLLEQAIALDSDYAEAHRRLAFNLWARWAHCGEPMDPSRHRSIEFAECAVTLDQNDAGNRWVLGHLLTYERCWSKSEAELATALKLDPSHANAWASLGDIPAFRGQPAAAIEQVQKAFRLDPSPAAWFHWELGLAYYAARQYESAIKTLRNDATYRTGSRRILAASLAQLGRESEARREGALHMASSRFFTISHWAATQPFRDETTLAHFVDGYRKAGLPE